jgi:hypothetical protein
MVAKSVGQEQSHADPRIADRHHLRDGALKTMAGENRASDA